jgi:hypothetical protein
MTYREFVCPLCQISVQFEASMIDPGDVVLCPYGHIMMPTVLHGLDIFGTVVLWERTPDA